MKYQLRHFLPIPHNKINLAIRLAPQPRVIPLEFAFISKMTKKYENIAFHGVFNVIVGMKPTSKTDSIAFMAQPATKQNKIKIHIIRSSSLNFLCVWVWGCWPVFNPHWSSPDPSFPKQLPVSHPIAEGAVLPPTVPFQHQLLNN